MDKLDELINDNDEEVPGFENLDTLFPPTDANQSSAHVISSNIEADEVIEPVVEETPKKRRGRPPKAAKAEPAEKVKKETKKSSAAEKKTGISTRKKPGPKPKVKVDDIPLEILDMIYSNYSKKPVEAIAKDIELPDSTIVEVIEKLRELFELNVASGSLSQENYEQYILPNLIEYNDENNLNTFVNSEIHEIQKTD